MNGNEYRDKMKKCAASDEWQEDKENINEIKRTWLEKRRMEAGKTVEGPGENIGTQAKMLLVNRRQTLNEDTEEEQSGKVSANQAKMPLADRLLAYVGEARDRLHVPGHKGNSAAETARELEALFSERTLKADITEIDGFDDFHCPEGIIDEAQGLAARLFGADESFFLVNGTTSGMMAAVAATAWEGAPILVSRDCHKSVMRGLILSGAMPVYLQNSFDGKLGIPTGVSVESVRTALQKNPGIRGIVLTNPSYYGTYSRLAEIVKICHSCGVVVIADEAHGAQLRFTAQDGIPDAMTAGCDISVQSTHKMLGSLTQSSMLHVRGNLVDRERLRAHVSLLNSTSPSYLLMASLDAVRCAMARSGNAVWKNILEMVKVAAEQIGEIDGIDCITSYNDAEGARSAIEGSRLLISALGTGISGRQLAHLLSRDYGIDVEFADERYVLAVAGSGTRRRDFDRLAKALRSIANEALWRDRENGSGRQGGQRPEKIREDEDNINSDEKTDKMKEKERTENYQFQPVPEFVHRSAMTPRQAFYGSQEEILLSEAAGRTAAREAAVYPPGIPVLYPGEEITPQIRDYLLSASRKHHIHGLIRSDDGQIRIRVVAERENEMLFGMYF